MSRRLAVLVAALVAVAATAGPAHAADDAWDIPDGARITIEGHGHGHGRGMSQYGAKRAAELGTGYRTIMKHYYPGTSRGKAPGSVRIWITRGDLDNAVQVRPRNALTARKVGGGPSWRLAKAQPRAKRWRIVPKGDARSVLQFRKGGWRHFRTVRGLLEFTAQGRPITLDTQGGRSATYRGVLRSVPSSPGNRLTVNRLSLESYLRGVVPKESIASAWPQQALRAQAVAARSYAAYHRAQRREKVFDLDDSESSQVYGGSGAEHAATDRAVRGTKAEIRTYDGEPAFTEFTASSGGWTVAGDHPYLVAQEDRWDDRRDPNHQWQVPFTDGELEDAWPALGDLSRIEIAGRDGHGEWGGRAGSVTLTGSDATLSLTGTAFYQRLGLRSSWLTLHVR
ncbi:MAG: SpoIID/LytB domain-containing protein [Nocardioides sp.]